MFKHRAIPWILVVFGIITAVTCSIRANRAIERAETAEAKLTRQMGLRLEAEDYAPATFVKLDGNTLYYKVPSTVRVGDESFLSSEEKTATVTEDVKVIGIDGKQGIDALRGISKGTVIRYSTTTSESGAQSIGVVIVVP